LAVIRRLGVNNVTQTIFSQCWNYELDAQLKKLGFKQNSNDPCINVSTTDSLLFLAIYVDDIVLAGKSQQTIAKIKTNLGKCF